jgi:hypothetical protein
MRAIMRGQAGAGLGGCRARLVRGREGPGGCVPHPGEGQGVSRGGAATALSNFNVFQPNQAQNNGKIQTKMVKIIKNIQVSTIIISFQQIQLISTNQFDPGQRLLQWKDVKIR